MTWDEYFLELAATAAKKSKDPECQVGVAIRGARNETLATGFNGPPVGIDDSVVADRQAKLRQVVHAEINALIFVDPQKLAGATLYTTKPVCIHCAPVLCQYHGLYGPLTIAQPPIDPSSSWAAGQQQALEMFGAVGVSVRSVGKSCHSCGHLKPYDADRFSCHYEGTSANCIEYGQWEPKRETTP